jgi:hypothetical protein
MPAKVTKRVQTEYEGLLKQVGENSFFNHVLENAAAARKHFEYPECVLLDQSDSFFSLYRTTGNENYFIIGRVLRRVAHKIYNDNKKKGQVSFNNKFLQLIKA